MMRIVFFGTPEFAIPSLKSLIKEHEIVAVVTQKDKPKGRGRKLLPTPVKQEALNLGLNVYQFSSLKSPNAIQILKKFNADYFVVVAYGRILTKEILYIPKFGCLNIHPSLLPKYRGPAPINWALINCEHKTGITIMELDEGMDTGPIVLQKEIQITQEMTAGSLLELTAKIGSEMLLEVLNREKTDGKKLPRIPQQGESSLAPLLDPKVGKIDWSLPAKKIACLARGIDPKPGAYSEFNNRRIKLYLPKVIELYGTPGEVLGLNDGYLVIATAKGAVGFKEVQPSGKKRMDAKAFWAGRPLKVGDILS